MTPIIKLSFVLLAMAGCSSFPSHVVGNEAGSAPINDVERVQYKQAILKCYKTGGTRVVKIEGNLRCY